MNSRSCVVVLSGGQDSTTCLALALKSYSAVYTIGFQYGQRHEVELQCRSRILRSIESVVGTRSLGPDLLVDMKSFGAIASCSLTEPGVPIAFDERTKLPNTFVPGRNLVFLTYAAALAWKAGARDIITGVGEQANQVLAEYYASYGSTLKVHEGQQVEAGDELTEGSVNPHDLLAVKGIRVQMYLLREVQRVYRLQGVDINDKHIEVMVRQMLKKVKVEESGDTNLLPGALVDTFDYEKVNEEAIEAGLEPAVAKPMLLGITKASLATDSFLSAASFQETTRVLTDAAIKGKVDPLMGLKENVIIGKLIPAGSGLSQYRQADEIDDEGAVQSDAAEIEEVDELISEAETVAVSVDAEGSEE